MFSLRFLFGVIVLVVIGVNYLAQGADTQRGYDTGEMTLGEISQFGAGLFWSVMTAQTVMVLGLTPALVADAIASERQAKTLHYLLASRLEGAEIVLGKLVARLLNVLVLLALVLPILSLLTLIGGVSPAGLVLGDAALASSAFFLAGLAMLVSVLARRPRDAVGAAYLLTGLWLFGPPVALILLLFVQTRWPIVAHVCNEVIDWVWPASPLGLVTNARAILGGGVEEIWRFATWLIGSQLAYGTTFLILSAWQLRPAYRRQEGRAGRLPKQAGRLARRSWIRPCGDDPIFWKEAYFLPVSGGLGRRVWRLFVLFVLGAAVVGTMAASIDAFRENATFGLGFSDYPTYQNRMALNFFLRYVGAFLFGIWMLWLGSLSAASFTSEREQDTWISLLATPLDGSEIVKGKMLGPLRTTAAMGVSIVALWLIGLLAGAVHPLGLINAAVVMGVMTWFVVALGTFTSLRAKATWRARLWTQGIFLAPNLCCMVPGALSLLGISLWSSMDLYSQFSIWDLWQRPWDWVLPIAYFFGGIAGYAAAAVLLTIATFRSFDRVAERPERSDVVLVKVEA